MHACERCGNFAKGNPKFCPYCGYHFALDPLRHTGKWAASDFFFDDSEVANTQARREAPSARDTPDEALTVLEWLRREGPPVLRSAGSFTLCVGGLLVMWALCWELGGGLRVGLYRLAPAVYAATDPWLAWGVRLGLFVLLVRRYPAWLGRGLRRLGLPPVQKAAAWREQQSVITMPTAIAISVLLISLGLRLAMNAMAERASRDVLPAVMGR